MDKICLDTDFLIDAMRGKEEAAVFLLDNEDKAIFAITYISLFELYRGAFSSVNEEDQVLAVDKLKTKFQMLNLSEESVKLAGKIMAKLKKTGEAIDFRDLFIGSIALVNGFAIKTGNLKHFNKIPQLKIV